MQKLEHDLRIDLVLSYISRCYYKFVETGENLFWYAERKAFHFHGSTLCFEMLSTSITSFWPIIMMIYLDLKSTYTIGISIFRLPTLVV